MTFFLLTPRRALLLWSCTLVLALPSTSRADTLQRTALLALKDSFLEAAASDPALTAEVTANFISWTPGSFPCSRAGSWPRVLCTGTRVTALNLSSAGLTGSIPAAISSLQFLKSLNFTGNAMEGPLPESLFQLTALTELRINLNRFSGALPDSITALTNLIFFQATGNQLAGALPPSLATMTSLQALDLSGNMFSGDIPDLSPLKKLTWLSLSVNQFSGSAPAWVGQLPGLVTLGLRSNNFNGALPDMAGSTSLQKLYLSSNSFTGPLPDGISRLTNLLLLFASQNNFTGGIPESIGRLTALQELDLSFNPGLGGSLPSSLSNLTSLDLIGLTRCNIQGSIPDSFTNMQGLKGMYLDNNQLSGSIPPSLGALSGLTQLFLSQNQFNGSIPDTLCYLYDLDAMDLSSNQLNGSIPSCLFSLPSLQGLVLSGNRFYGPIPSEIPPSLYFKYEGNCLTHALEQDPSCADMFMPGGVATWVWVVTGVGLLVLASLGVLGIILLCKRAKTWKPWKLSFPWQPTKPWKMMSFKRAKPAPLQPLHVLSSLPVTEFTLKEVEESTRSFTARLSKGNYGNVYLAVGLFAGQGPHNYRSLVKRATNPAVMDLSESAYKDQVATLAAAQHRYIVRLKGYCVENNERILVYEFMAKGALQSRLHAKNQEPIPWNARMRIAACLASALEYLHHSMKPPLVHGAVTSANVLLTSDLTPKLSDLGIARGSGAPMSSTGLAKIDRTSERTKRRRQRHSHTREGREDPEKSHTEGEEEGEGPGQRDGVLGQKADVWGFGVILLELISGQEVMKDVHITIVARPFLENPNVTQLLVDQQLGFNYNASELLVLASIARSCINEDPLQRPTMREVVQSMKETALVDSRVFEVESMDDISLVSPSKTSIRKFGVKDVKRDILSSLQSRQRRGFENLSPPDEVELGAVPAEESSPGGEDTEVPSAQRAGPPTGLVAKLLDMAGDILLTRRQRPPSPRTML